MRQTFLASLILIGKFSRIAHVLSHPGLASPTIHSLAFVPPLIHPTSSIFEPFLHEISSNFRFSRTRTPDLVTNHYSICLSLAHLPSDPPSIRLGLEPTRFSTFRPFLMQLYRFFHPYVDFSRTCAPDLVITTHLRLPS